MPVFLKKKHRFLYSIDEEVYRRIRKGEWGSFIYVAPTNRKLRELQRELLNAASNGAAPAYDLYTLESLARQMHSIICQPRHVITGLEQTVIMNEAIHNVAGSLRYFRLKGSRENLPPGTLQRVIDVINSFKDKGIYRSVLSSELESVESYEREKLNDILLIYDAYENQLGGTFIDAAGLFKQINEAWDSAKSPQTIISHFRNVDTVFVSGFDEFSDPELTMLHNLSVIPQFGMLISFDYNTDNNEVFGHLKENYKKFLEMGFELIKTKPAKKIPFHEHVSKHLFLHNGAPTKYPAKVSVTVAAADDRKNEVEIIAKLIKHLADTKPDRDLSKICISVFKPQLYTNLFREIFEQYGIPANITDRYYLNQSPVIISVLSLLAIKHNNFNINDIMRSLSSPYIRIMNNGTPVDGGNIYDTAVMLHISAGYSNWLTKIDKQMEYLRTLTESLDDVIEIDQKQQLILMLQKAKSDLQTLHLTLRPLEDQMTPGGFRDHLLGLLEKTHVAECVLGGKPILTGEQLEKDTRAYQKFIGFLNSFVEIFTIEGEPDGKKAFSFYFNRLKETISQVRYNIRQKYGHGVVITSFDETRGLKFDVMIIAGLVDGEFPPAYRPEIFHSSARRAQRELYHLHEHRYLFYQAVTNHTEHLFLTYPKRDSDQDLIPSSFIDSFLKIVETGDWRRSLPDFINQTIFSKSELIHQLGRASGEDLPLPGFESEGDAVKNELTEIFNYLLDAQKIENSRSRGDIIPEHDGIINALKPSINAALARLRDHIFSITQLETYGKCPFQFFSNRILRLHTIKEIEEGLTPIDQGNILHETLYNFYSDRIGRKLPHLSDLSDEEFTIAVNDLLDHAQKTISRLNITDPFWEIDKENILGGRRKKGILREFAELERNSDLDVKPSHFEVAFGPRVGSRKNTDSGLSTDEPIIVNKTKLRGKIDRVDLGKGIFRIIDYKTGQIAGRREIDLGISLQLPIYLYAVEHILSKRAGKKEGVAGVYYILKSPVKEKIGIGNKEYEDRAFKGGRKSGQICETSDEFREVIRQAIGYVNEYVDKITGGYFAVEPKLPDETCKYCDYQTICRIQSRIPFSDQAENVSPDDN